MKTRTGQRPKRGARGRQPAEPAGWASGAKARAKRDARTTETAKKARPAKKAETTKKKAAAADSSRLSGAARKAYERRKQRASALEGTGETGASLKASAVAARIPFVALIIALLGVGMALTLLLTTRAAEESYAISADRKQNQHLAEEKASLERDVESADSAPDLAAKARDLGMIPARDPARIVVAPDGSVVVIGKPEPAQGQPAPLLNTQVPGQLQGNSPNTSGGGSRPQTSTPPGRTDTQVQAQGEQLVPVQIQPPQPTQQPQPTQPPQQPQAQR